MTEKSVSQPRYTSRAFRTTAGLFFAASGVLLVLAFTSGGPSFWYWLCAVVWLFFAVAWFFEPIKAAAFTLPPIVGMLVLLAQWIRPASNQEIGSWFWIWTAITAVALALVVLVLAESRKLKFIQLSVSAGIILIGFYIDKTYMNQQQIKTYQMSWSASGNLPWGKADASPASITIYRTLNGEYCYDDFHSPELKQQLVSGRKSLITVQYNEFADFDKVRSYSVRSVDGVLLQDDHKVIKDWWTGGGRMEMGNSTNSSSSSDCH